ncbi:hypothetical protein DSM3645_03453 [Blastopirellula marina DSM 3645]|uniref:Uncharacterized protein n=1 Tax=Blastopirellula marina DSM 3645 TaxID=314230 RepID=A3ZW04_9BACT|nr:hypothetical protein DSM3645_03453 [Blastopirellula marina DSM 3645]
MRIAVGSWTAKVPKTPIAAQINITIVIGNKIEPRSASTQRSAYFGASALTTDQATKTTRPPRITPMPNSHSEVTQ